MNVLMNNIIDLAQRWRTYAITTNGWKSIHYFEDEYESVSCYFAKNSNHSTVTFYFAGETVDVAFFKPPEIMLKSKDYDQLARNILRFFSEKLDNMPNVHNTARTEKEVRKEYLLNELSKLE